MSRVYSNTNTSSTTLNIEPPSVAVTATIGPECMNAPESQATVNATPTTSWIAP